MNSEERNALIKKMSDLGFRHHNGWDMDITFEDIDEGDSYQSCFRVFDSWEDVGGFIDSLK